MRAALMIVTGCLALCGLLCVVQSVLYLRAMRTLSRRLDDALHRATRNAQLAGTCRASLLDLLRASALGADDFARWAAELAEQSGEDS